MKKRIILPAIIMAATVTLAGWSTITAHAQSTDSPQQSMVTKLAAKFNVKEADVQAVFDQNRQDHQTEMEATQAERLAKLVTDGKITSAQKELIAAKHKELQTARDANHSTMQAMTATERKAAMEKQQTELEQWATANGIDPQYIMSGNGHRGPPRGWNN